MIAMRRTIQWRRDNRRDCPGTMYFFKDVFFRKDKAYNKQLSVQDMVKRLSNKMKMPR